MSDLEKAQTQKEALEQVPRRSSSTKRARLWAGLNRYLAAEADHAHRSDRPDKGDEKDTDQRTPPEKRPEG